MFWEWVWVVWLLMTSTQGRVDLIYVVVLVYLVNSVVL